MSEVKFSKNVVNPNTLLFYARFLSHRLSSHHLLYHTPRDNPQLCIAIAQIADIITPCLCFADCLKILSHQKALLRAFCHTCEFVKLLLCFFV
ncbi:hypothetical protein [Helicobacter sp. T3_23-1056]